LPGKAKTHPLRSVVNTFSHANHLIAFWLIAMLMIGGFTVYPFLPTYLVNNVGISNEHLPWVYIVGGALTLVTAPIIGRLADWCGKLTMYRILNPGSAAMLLAITYLPPASMYVAIAVFGALLVCNVGRMIAAMSMITSSVEPNRRGAFLSANSSVQHIASGLGAYLGGLIVTQAPDGKIEHFDKVGWFAAACTIATIWIAGRVRVIEGPIAAAEAMSLAATEIAVDAGEPMLGYSSATEG
jgi:predicted MFS family arabinose efflux permease